MAREIFAALEDAGATPFEFEESSHFGTSAWREVLDSIKSSDWFLALLTDEAIERRPVLAEIQYAFYCWANEGKPELIPAPIEEVTRRPIELDMFTELPFLDRTEAIGRLVQRITVSPRRGKSRVSSASGATPGAVRVRDEDLQASLSSHLAGAERVALLLTGAGARGAFQAGALAVLIPALESAGIRPTVVIGTGAGAINAALYGSLVDRNPEQALEELAALWTRLGHRDFYGSLLNESWTTGLQFALGAYLGVGHGVTSLLDTSPLARTIEDLFDADRLCANVEDGLLSAVGVVATRLPAGQVAAQGATGGRSVLFLHEHERSRYEGAPEHALDVARTKITDRHVLASAAVPMAFTPLRISSPRKAEGWYVDGGVHLSAPLGLAVSLGADKIIIISSSSVEYPDELPPDDAKAEAPSIADAAAQVWRASSVDHLTGDLLAVRRMNRLIRQVAEESDGQVTLRHDDSRPYRPIEFMMISPAPGEMGRLAESVEESQGNGLKLIREPDAWLLGRSLRGAGSSTGRREILSYLLFDQHYFTESVKLGRDAAARGLSVGWES